MSQSSRALALAVSILAYSFVAGCAQQATGPTPPPTHDAATSGPELAGAWYQIYFDTGSSALNARGQMIVTRVAYAIKHGDPARVTVIGRTDRVGSAPDNLALSHQRTNAVRDALVASGVPAAIIDTSWIGEGVQADAAADDAVNPRNRAVDLTVVKQSR
jgi:peptidoglycan-associated lipoprotein